MRIVKAGISSLQDLGRTGYRNIGIHTGGAMDRMALRLCNLLVANELVEAAIEISAGPFEVTTQRAHLLAVGGNGQKIWCGGRPVNCWEPFLIQPGEKLRIEMPKGGYGILAVHGGLRCPLVLNSRSTHLTGGFGGWHGRLLNHGDEIPTSRLVSATAEKIIRQLSGQGNQRRFRLSDSAIPHYKREFFRFVPGAESDWFEQPSLNDLQQEAFELTALSNRTGARLAGTPLRVQGQPQMVSTAVVPGTMQVSANGQLLVLLADAQTAGGYPRIGQLAATDIGPLAQQRPGSKLHFKAITATEAEELCLRQKQGFDQLKKDYFLYFG